MSTNKHFKDFSLKRVNFILKQEYPTKEDRFYLNQLFYQMVQRQDRRVAALVKQGIALKKSKDIRRESHEKLESMESSLVEVCEYLLDGGKPRSVSFARKLIEEYYLQKWFENDLDKKGDSCD